MRASVRACVRACACKRACVRACVRTCVRACVLYKVSYPERSDVFLFVDDRHYEVADDLLKLADAQMFAVGRLGQVVPERVRLLVVVKLYAVDGDLLQAASNRP